jgi:methionyl-tRNA formyltransferase
VTIMQMDEKLDHGPLLAARDTAIGEREDAAALGARLADLGADLLVDTLARLDGLQPREQDHASATLAPKLAREDGALDWQLDAQEIDRRVRAFQPWPGVTVPFQGDRVKVLKGHPGNGSGAAGQVLAVDGEGVEVAAARGSYVLEEVQPPGRRSLPARILVARDG